MSLFQLFSSQQDNSSNQIMVQKDEKIGGREAVVNTSDKKVKVESDSQPEWIVGKIYAEWCGHCKNMKEAWEKLKNKIKEEKGGEVEFVEIEDIEMGERIPSMNEKYFHKEGSKKGGIESSGFPTIFMFHVDKAPETLTYYKGEREMTPMKNWIEENREGKSKKGGCKGGSRKIGVGKRGSRKVGKKGGKKRKTQSSKSRK